MATKFRSKIWDPFLIISQIVSMQFQFYSTLLLINYLTNRFLVLFDLTEENYSLDHIFNHKLVNFGNVSNAFMCINLVLNSFLRFVPLKIRLSSCFNSNYMFFSYLVPYLNGSSSTARNNVSTLPSLSMFIT